MHKKCGLLYGLLLLFSSAVYSVTPPTAGNLSTLSDADVIFDDSQLEDELVYPDWFKLSLGDLNDDLDEAKQAGKKGIITYFGQKRCAYCEQFFKTSLAGYRARQSHLAGYCGCFCWRRRCATTTTAATTATAGAEKHR